MVHDTEDRAWWHIHGENLERKFVELCRDKLGIDAQINPEKESKNYVPDLIVKGKLADLKTQNTPFFTAARHGVEPRFAVTFNRKDYERYKEHYPQLMIYFWVDWQSLEGYGAKFDYYGGVFSLPFSEVAKLIEGSAEHDYQRRQDPGNVNSRSSFVLDIRKFNCIVEFKNEKVDF